MVNSMGTSSKKIAKKKSPKEKVKRENGTNVKSVTLRDELSLHDSAQAELSRKFAEGEPLEVEVPGDKFVPHYSNLVLVTHLKDEFVLDFAWVFKGASKVVSRIAISPDHASRLAAVLADSLKKHKKEFGEG